MSQLNPLTQSIGNFLPPRPIVGHSRLPVAPAPSQDYPPNVAYSLVTTKLPSVNELIIEPTDPDAIFKGIEFFPGNVSFHFLQEPVVYKVINTKASSIRASDLIVHDIDELMAGKEDEEKPTAFAYAYARQVLEAAYGKARVAGNLPNVVPKPLATTDDVGGIRILWHLGTRNVRLNFGATKDRRSYLYYEADLIHGVEPLDEDHLATRLAWLTGK
jgi:hypothetical protein